MPFLIAFVDDAAMLRITIANLIEKLAPQYKVFQYIHGKDLQERLPDQNYQPHLFLMDVSMPYVNGYDATIWAKKKYPNTPVLAFTMHNNEATIIKMYNAGANGFITKNSNPNALLEAIEEVRSGNFYHNINADYKVAKNTLYKNNKIIQPSNHLTDQEEHVLRLLISELSYKQIAQQLGLGLRTVETHKHNISVKLDIHTREGLMLYAFKTGLMTV